MAPRVVLAKALMSLMDKSLIVEISPTIWSTTLHCGKETCLNIFRANDVPLLDSGKTGQDWPPLFGKLSSISINNLVSRFKLRFFRKDWGLLGLVWLMGLYVLKLASWLVGFREWVEKTTVGASWVDGLDDNGVGSEFGITCLLLRKESLWELTRELEWLLLDWGFGLAKQVS